MNEPLPQLAYIRNGWYFKTFAKRPGYHVAMANSRGFPDSLLDFVQQHVWFESGDTPLEACEKLEKKMGMS